MILNGWGFLRGNWYCYQAVVEDLFHNAQRPGRVRSGYRIRSHRVGSGHGSKSRPGSISGCIMRCGGFLGFNNNLLEIYYSVCSESIFKIDERLAKLQA